MSRSFSKALQGLDLANVLPSSSRRKQPAGQPADQLASPVPSQANAQGRKQQASSRPEAPASPIAAAQVQVKAVAPQPQSPAAVMASSTGIATVTTATTTHEGPGSKPGSKRKHDKKQEEQPQAAAVVPAAAVKGSKRLKHVSAAPEVAAGEPEDTAAPTAAHKGKEKTLPKGRGNHGKDGPNAAPLEPALTAARDVPAGAQQPVVEPQPQAPTSKAGTAHAAGSHQTLTHANGEQPALPSKRARSADAEPAPPASAYTPGAGAGHAPAAAGTAAETSSKLADKQGAAEEPSSPALEKLMDGLRNTYGWTGTLSLEGWTVAGELKSNAAKTSSHWVFSIKRPNDAKLYRSIVAVADALGLKKQQSKGQGRGAEGRKDKEGAAAEQGTGLTQVDVAAAAAGPSGVLTGAPVEAPAAAGHSKAPADARVAAPVAAGDSGGDVGDAASNPALEKLVQSLEKNYGWQGGAAPLNSWTVEGKYNPSWRGWSFKIMDPDQRMYKNIKAVATALGLQKQMQQVRPPTGPKPSTGQVAGKVSTAAAPAPPMSHAGQSKAGRSNAGPVAGAVAAPCMPAAVASAAAQAGTAEPPAEPAVHAAGLPDFMALLHAVLTKDYVCEVGQSLDGWTATGSLATNGQRYHYSFTHPQHGRQKSFASVAACLGLQKKAPVRSAGVHKDTAAAQPVDGRAAKRHKQGPVAAGTVGGVRTLAPDIATAGAATHAQPATLPAGSQAAARKPHPLQSAVDAPAGPSGHVGGSGSVHVYPVPGTPEATAAAATFPPFPPEAAAWKGLPWPALAPDHAAQTARLLLAAKSGESTVACLAESGLSVSRERLQAADEGRERWQDVLAFPMQEVFMGKYEQWGGGEEVGVPYTHSPLAYGTLLCSASGHSRVRGRVYVSAECARLADTKPQQPGQVSKLCHMCDAQHIAAPCAKCSVSICDMCARTSFPTWSRVQLMLECPCCVGCCSCMRCLAKEVEEEVVTYSPAVRSLMDRLALTHLQGLVTDILATAQSEVQHDRMPTPANPRQGRLYSSLSAVPTIYVEDDNLERTERLHPCMGPNGSRLHCNKCRTAIADLHYACASCDWEVCAYCARDERTMLPGARLPGGVRPCLNTHCAGGVISPRRLLGGAWGDVLQLMVGTAALLPPSPTEHLMRQLAEQLHTEALAAQQGQVQAQAQAVAAQQVQALTGDPLQLDQDQSVGERAAVAPQAATVQDEVRLCVQLQVVAADEEGHEPGQQELVQLQLQVMGVVLQAPSGTPNGPAADASRTHARASSTRQQPPDEQGTRPQEQRGPYLWFPQWGRWVHEENVRRARSCGDDYDWLFTPHARALKPGHPDYVETLLLVHHLWSRRCPVIVRGTRGAMPLLPAVMKRCLTLECNQSEEPSDFKVIDCEDAWQVKAMTEAAFFEAYEGSATGEEPMYKVKDWPPKKDFHSVVKHHNKDYHSVLPIPWTMHTRHGPLNLATLLPDWALRPDLGPKTYIATGRVEEKGEGDSETKLHQDMSDAINVLVHTQLRPGELPAPRYGLRPSIPGSDYDAAGALWDIWSVEDVPVLRAYLTAELASPSGAPFMKAGVTLGVHNTFDVVFDHSITVSSRHINRMAAGMAGGAPGGAPGGAAVERSIQPWRFEQHQEEAVMIPGGTPHQVRNLRSCTKVASDFVSPEALVQCVAMKHGLRAAAARREVMEGPPKPLNHRSPAKGPPTRNGGEEGEEHGEADEQQGEEEEDPYEDKLQGELILLTAAAQAFRSVYPQLFQGQPALEGTLSNPSTATPLTDPPPGAVVLVSAVPARTQRWDVPVSVVATRAGGMAAAARASGKLGSQGVGRAAAPSTTAAKPYRAPQAMVPAQLPGGGGGKRKRDVGVNGHTHEDGDVDGGRTGQVQRQLADLGVSNRGRQRKGVKTWDSEDA